MGAMADQPPWSASMVLISLHGLDPEALLGHYGQGRIVKNTIYLGRSYGVVDWSRIWNGLMGWRVLWSRLAAWRGLWSGPIGKLGDKSGHWAELRNESRY